MLTLIALGFSPNAYALQMDYYTYNGFDQVVSSWQFAAMVFNNSDYKTLFIVFIAMGALFGAAALYLKIIARKSGDPIAWMWPALIGFILYVGIFTPKGTIHVYDPVLNKYQPVNGVPDGIIAIAGSLNLLERGIVDIINTSGPPLSYKEAAGGIGFDSLNKITSVKVSDLDNGYIRQSTEHYIVDCVMFELSRPGTQLSMSSFLSGNDLLAAFGQAANPAVYTLWYADSDGYRTGVSVTCDVAFSNIQSYYNDTAVTDQWLRANCGKLGFDTTDNTQLMQCKQIVQDSAQYVTGSSMTANKFMQQAALSAFMNDVAVNGGIDQSILAAGNSNIMSSMYSVGILANEYMPLIRSIVIAVAISLLPIIVLFAATSVVGRAMALAAGFFIFLSAWGVTDALMHGLATNYSYQFFQQARDNNLGYASMIAMPGASAKAVGLFGIVRIIGIALAGMMSKTLVGFGAELASVAGTMAGQIQGAGAGAGRMATQEGTASSVREYAGSRATMENAHNWGYEQRAGAMAMSESSGIARAAEKQQTMGGSYVGAGATEGRALGNRDVQHTWQQQEASAAMGGNKELATRGSQVGAAKEAGNLQATSRNAKAFFGNDSLQSMISLQKLEEQGLLDERSATAANKALGFKEGDSRSPFHAGMKVDRRDWGAGDDGKLMILGASSQDGTGHVRIGSGGITKEQYITSALQGLRLANQEFKAGHGFTAHGIAGMYNEKYINRELAKLDAAGSAGDKKSAAEAAELGGYARTFGHDFQRGQEGIRDDESIHFTQATSFDGKTATMTAQHGSKSVFFNEAERRRLESDRREVTKTDTVTERAGVTKWSGTNIQHQDVNEAILSHGLQINHAAQMAQNADASLVSQVTSINEGQARETARLVTVSAVANDLSSLIKRTGTSEDRSHASASVGGGKIFRGETGVAYQSMDSKQTSLAAQHYNEVWEKAEKDVSAAPKNVKDAYIAQKLQEAVNEDVSYFKEHGKWSFGATGTASKAVEGVVQFFKGGDADKKSDPGLPPESMAPKG